MKNALKSFVILKISKNKMNDQNEKNFKSFEKEMSIIYHVLYLFFKF